MKKMLALGLVAATLLLTGCEKPEKFEERRITVAVDHVELRHKRFSTVDLRDVQSHQLYKGNRLHCSRSYAANVELGSKWDVTEVTMFYPESKRYSTELVGTEAICDLSN